MTIPKILPFFRKFVPRGSQLLLFATTVLATPGLRGYSADNQNSCLGLNLAGTPSYGQDWVYVDAFKIARSWISQQTGQPWGGGPALDLDSEGWVRSLQANCSAETLILDGAPEAPAGTYVLLYEGEGTIVMSGGGVSSTTPDGPGRALVEVNPAAGFISLRITAVNPANYLRHIRLIMPGYESTSLSQPFHPAFLANWKKFKVFRFMDWLETNNSPVVNWSDRQTLTTHGKTGNALEHIVTLCNTLQTDCWICVPHLATNDFVRKMAILIRSGYDMGSVDVSGVEGDNWTLSQGTLVCEPLDSTLKVYIEYSNECWNSMFGQTGYCQQQGVIRYPQYTATPWEAGPLFYSERSVEIFQIFETLFGGVNRLQRVMAWQSGSDAILTMLDHNQAYRYTDYAAIAPYFGGYLGSPETQDTIATWSIDQVLDACQAHLATQMTSAQRQIGLIDDRVNLQGHPIQLLQYESGQHLVGTGGAENNQTLTDLFNNCNRAARMRQLYLEYYSMWRDIRGGIPCVFSSMGNFSKWGSWGILENHSEDPFTKPKYLACMQFIDSNSPWWEQSAPPEPPAGNSLLLFQGSALPANVTVNRPLQDIGNPVTAKRIDFSTANGGHLFNCPGYPAGQFYGGFLMDFGASPIGERPASMSLNPSNDRFESNVDGGNGGFSKIADCFLWRRDQFTNPSATRLGKITINVLSLGFGELRFVIRDGSTYYVSSFVATSSGSYTLDGFNNSSSPFKMWKVWVPTATDFEAESPQIGFSPMTFTNVTEVGFVHYTARESWGHGFSFDRFEVFESSPQDFTVTLNAGDTQTNPTVSTPVRFKAVFNQPTSNFTSDDVTIGGSALPTTKNVTQLAPMDGTTYDVAVSGMTLSGTVVAAIPAGVCTSTAGGYPNFASTTANNAIQYNIANASTVTVNQAASQADPTGSLPIHFTAVFSDPVTGFTNADVSLGGTALPSTVTVTEIAPLNGTTYDLAVGGTAHDGTVTASLPAGVALNGYGAANLASTSTDNAVTLDTTVPPSVTIDQASGQADPAFSSPILFTVIFSQAVTGFTGADVVLSGTAGATTAAATETAPNNGTTFQVSVSGMTANGTVLASIPAGVCTGNVSSSLNLASTSTDNSVLYFNGTAQGVQVLNFDLPAATPTDVDFGNYGGTPRAYTINSGNLWRWNFDTADTGRFFSNPWSTCTTLVPWFHGGLEARANNAVNDVNLFMWRQGNVTSPRKVDVYAYDNTGGPDQGFSCQGLFLWRQDQFINGGASGVILDNTSTLSLHYTGFNSDITGSQVRFVVRSGGQYYLSQYALTTGLYGGESITLNSLGTVNWALFNPTATAFGITGTEVYDQTLNNAPVTEVGFAFTCGRPQYAGGFSFDRFTCAATLPAPTPATPPQVRPNLSGANLQLRFQGTNAKVYILQQSTNLRDWSPAGQQLTSTGVEESFSVDKPSSGAIFYRVARQD